MWSGDDIHFMKLALEEGEEADRRDEVPIGAILVMDGRLVAARHNCPITSNDPTAHAEVMALRSAEHLVLYAAYLAQAKDDAAAWRELGALYQLYGKTAFAQQCLDRAWRLGRHPGK